MANSGWNYTIKIVYITLSFWVKSSVAQNFYGYLLLNQMELIKIYPFETGALSINTWTKIIKNNSRQFNVQFDNNNGFK